MTTRITAHKKIVCAENKHYHLIYNLLSEDDVRYGIEVICRYANVTETEQLWLGTNRAEAFGILSLFAKETVFPVALRETWENL